VSPRLAIIPADRTPLSLGPVIPVEERNLPPDAHSSGGIFLPLRAAPPAPRLGYDPVRRPCGRVWSFVFGPPLPRAADSAGALPLDQLTDPDPVDAPVDDDFNMLAIPTFWRNAPGRPFHGTVWPACQTGLILRGAETAGRAWRWLAFRSSWWG
jgi:hypothetical protein